MIRFIHTADWQLGARFKQFGGKGGVLREARLKTLRRVLELARKEAVDALLIAGDLFEDNQIEDSLVESVVGLFGEFDSVPVHVLPGNHDPYTGLDSVWQRTAFLKPPGNVHVMREAGVISLGSGAELLASPLQQKLSTKDPSECFIEMAKALPEDAIRIGMTHGAPAIEGKHQPNDFPIALNAASRAGLDYLALGHWHNWLADTDGGRMVMPGTPEPEQFANERSGNVALVEIEGHGKPLKVAAIPVGTLQWQAREFDFLDPVASMATLEAEVAALASQADRTVFRITMRGGASPITLVEARTKLEAMVAPFLVGQLVDKTVVALTALERQDLQARHPILTQVLADIDRMETLATGESAENDPGESPLTLAEVQTILSSSKTDLAALSPELFGKLRQVLFAALQEVSS